MGATMGLLLWSYVIGLIVSAVSGNFDYLINIAFVGSIISIFPCILGMFRLIGIERRGCCAECDKNVFDCQKQ
jgi:hypothetical protein